MKRITLSTFRKVSAAEEMMMRAMMPTISAADPVPLPKFAAAAPVVVASTAGTRLVKPLTATLAEVSAS
jgi:hypothetical protein